MFEPWKKEPVRFERGDRVWVVHEPISGLGQYGTVLEDHGFIGIRVVYEWETEPSAFVLIERSRVLAERPEGALEVGQRA